VNIEINRIHQSPDLKVKKQRHSIDASLNNSEGEDNLNNAVIMKNAL
jgi:hypothetical protein